MNVIRSASGCGSEGEYGFFVISLVVSLLTTTILIGLSGKFIPSAFRHRYQLDYLFSRTHLVASPGSSDGYGTTKSVRLIPHGVRDDVRRREF
jgi:hypothetical protein